MSATVRSRVVWALCALALVLLGASVVLALLNDLRTTGDFGTRAYPLLICVPGVTFPVVGALMASRQPGNAVGWVCLAMGVGIASDLAATQLALRVTAPWAAWWSTSAVFAFVSCVFVILLFPNGRLPSSRWRPVAVLAGLGVVGMSVAAALRPGVMDPFGVRNPVGVAGASSVLRAIEAVSFPLLVLGILGAAASMVVRFRHGSGRERTQIKWFALVAGLLALMAPLENVTPLAEDAVVVLFGSLPAAAGIAILRHGLYDIDVVLNRALVYAALTATLAGAYLSVVLLLGLVLSSSSHLAVAASTLAAAALFRPARARIQAAVDRRFYRHKYDASRTLERFGARLRDRVDLGELEADLSAVVRDTMQPEHVSLWLRAPSRVTS